MRLYRRVFLFLADFKHFSDVTVSENGRRKMCHYIVDISYDRKGLPTLSGVGIQKSPNGTRTTEAVALQATPQIRSVIPDV